MPTPTPFPSKSNALRRLKAAGLQVATILDVGAHEQTLELRLEFPAAKHVLFEPAEDFYPKIHENYAGMDYELVPLAISNRDGVGALKKFAIDGGGVSHTTLADPKAAGVHSVPTRRLDTFLAAHAYAAPFLLKIDVDGYEVPILESLGSFAAHVACVIMEATKDTFVERLNALASRGFQLIDIVDPCYYAGVFSQADLICVSPAVAALPALRPWETAQFGWDKWVPVASFEGLVPGASAPPPAPAPRPAGGVRPKRVVCGGLNRSGSTWQYNIVRALLSAAAGPEQVYGAWVEDYEVARPARLHVVKAHRPEQVQDLPAQVTVSSIRDLRAVAASLGRMSWLDLTDRDQVFQALDDYVAAAEAWGACASYVMRYEKMLDAPEATAAEIAAVLGLRASEQQIREIVAWVSGLTPPAGPPTAGPLHYDRETQLHAGHIGERSDEAAVMALPDELRRAIEDRYGSWLKANGYG